MDRFGTLSLLVFLHFLYFCAAANNDCCNGQNTEVEIVGCNNDCKSDCDCSEQVCKSCQGHDKCCNYCCNNNCNCQSVSCTSCSSSSTTNDCCSNCCNNKCRSSGCSTRQCRQCQCDNCNTKPAQNNACCNSCCNKQVEAPASANVSQITTLPNITIIINHAPIYVNNTPVINTEHRCGNASVLTNGTHIVYVYPQNSTCNNRTCCSRMVRRPCQIILPPRPPVCPPPAYISDCSSHCHHGHVAPPMPPPIYACQYFQTWPYVHCPQTGCYGMSCAPPHMSMYMQSAMMQQGQMYSGCFATESWPFVRCGPGMEGDSMMSYGPPSTQMIGAGGEGATMQFGPQVYSSLGYNPGMVPMQQN